jgi:hypothetical protein
MKRSLVLAALVAVACTVAFAYEIDMGDLSACDYPTLFVNPGHSISGIAWLGPCVTPDPSPNIPDQDQCDDGVVFIGIPWTPCGLGQVQIQVTAGPFYPFHVAQGGRLYLNAWKDGNLDGDFCDALCNGQAPEWIVQDELVTPGVWTYTFPDPGVTDFGIYDGIFRFRLTRVPLGPYGFGLYDTTQCPEMCHGTFAYDSLGEVEDYVIHDMQLAVNLSSFTAVPGNERVLLTWITASEIQNATFELRRDDQRIAQIASRSSGPTGCTYQYGDQDLQNGVVYTYSLIAVDVNGVREQLSTVSASPRADESTPSDYALYQNFPNPFNPTTTIAFSLAADGFVNLKLYNVAGQEVRTIVSGVLAAGYHTVGLDAGTLPSGVYLCVLTAGDFRAARKLMLIR